MTKTIFEANPVMTNDNEYYTYAKTWDRIKDYIPNDKIIAEPFGYNPNLEGFQYLKSICKEVRCCEGDFFKNDFKDIECIISNPPYNPRGMKEKIFRRLKQLDIPFIMLVPSTCLHTKYLYDIFNNEDIQILMPNDEINFYQIKDSKILKRNNCSFYTCFICYKMNLDKDLIFI